MYLLDYFIQLCNFLVQNYWNSIDKCLINYIFVWCFINVGMFGVIGEYYNIVGEICVMCFINIK